MAALNVLLDVEGVDVGGKLREFEHETGRMLSPLQVKGLAVSNAHFIRQAHNALARSVIIHRDPCPSLEPDPPQASRYASTNKCTRDQSP